VGEDKGEAPQQRRGDPLRAWLWTPRLRLGALLVPAKGRSRSRGAAPRGRLPPHCPRPPSRQRPQARNGPRAAPALRRGAARPALADARGPQAAAFRAAPARVGTLAALPGVAAAAGSGGRGRRGHAQGGPAALIPRCTSRVPRTMPPRHKAPAWRPGTWGADVGLPRSSSLLFPCPSHGCRLTTKRGGGGTGPGSGRRPRAHRPQRRTYPTHFKKGSSAAFLVRPRWGLRGGRATVHVRPAAASSSVVPFRKVGRLAARARGMWKLWPGESRTGGPGGGSLEEECLRRRPGAGERSTPRKLI